MEKFIITRQLFDQIYEQAKAEAPREICGMIGGRDSTAAKVYPADNVDKSNLTYSIDPAEAFSVVRRVRDDGLELIACYHSHPATEAYPSPTDRAKAGDSDLIYAIMSLRRPEEPELRAFKLGQGRVDELIVEINP